MYQHLQEMAQRLQVSVHGRLASHWSLYLLLWPAGGKKERRGGMVRIF